MDKICITDIFTEKSVGNRCLITHQTEALVGFSGSTRRVVEKENEERKENRSGGATVQTWNFNIMHQTARS